MIMNRFLIASLATIWSVICLADGDPRPINIAKCLENNCMAQDVHVFTPEENFKVQAWFDVVSFPDKPIPYFYPLFNVFNYSNNEAELVVGMQLIDQAGKVLLEATDKAVFKPTEKTEGSY